MILQELHTYYQRMSQDGSIDIARPGFAVQKIHYEIVINASGKLIDFAPRMKQSGKKLVPDAVMTPEPVKRSSGVAANFLCDNTGYVLGADDKGKPERARKQFEAFRALHHEIGDGVDDGGMRAVLAFLDGWDPEQAEDLPKWEEIVGKNLAFKLDGDVGFIHDRPAVREAWLCHKEGVCSEESAMCLVTGKKAPIARLHPAIKGVPGAQTSGAALSSFNLDSFKSYGKEQNFNAPISESAAFAYTTMLNYLLAPDSRQNERIGDTKLVFWTDAPSEAVKTFAEHFNPAAGEKKNKAHDEGLLQRQRVFLEAVRQGELPDELKKEGEVGFYILGLAPNASRLSVRFWLVSTVRKIYARLAKHYNDIHIEKRYEKEPDLLAPWKLLSETALQGKSENVPPLLSGRLAKAILGGGRYPEDLYTRVITRIRAEQEVSYGKAAIIKGWLQRNRNMEVSVSLNPDERNIGYLLGRLFAVLEKAQRLAETGTGGTSTVSRKIASAAATPGVVFPRMMALCPRHHEKAMRMDGKKGLVILNKKRLVDISDMLDPKIGFPMHLDLKNQGLFFLGYYQQQKDIITPKDKTEKED